MEPPALLLPSRLISASLGCCSSLWPGSWGPHAAWALVGPPAAPPEQAGLGCELVAWLAFPHCVLRGPGSAVGICCSEGAVVKPCWSGDLHG